MKAPLLVAQVLNGLATGMLYALMGIGLSLITGVLNIPNFAHGALFALGAYCLSTVVQLTGSFWLALVLAPVAVGLLGVLIEYGGIRPLYRAGHDSVIGINALDAAVRQRFTIAHEIGHLLLHAEPLHLDPGHNLAVMPPPTGTKPALRFSRNQISSKAKDPREIEANRFAAALLMPAHFLSRDLRGMRIPITEDAIAELAMRYQVSRQAMTFRLMNLGVPMETI